MAKNTELDKWEMSKFTVKTKLSNIKKEGNEFTYDQEIVSMKWDAYADRKRYQLGYGNESPSPILKEYFNSGGVYPTHVIEPYNTTEETKMACNNIDCHCENCTCDPCECTIDNPCGCDEISDRKKSKPTGRIENEWKGVV